LSRKAKTHYFTQVDRFEKSLSTMSEEEIAKMDGAKDTDTISYFNRTRGKKDE